MIKYNHKNKIEGSQHANIKAIYPGMFVSFDYRKHTVFDRRPLLLILHKDYISNLLHGINLNYLTEYKLKQLIKKIEKGAGVYSETKNITRTEDQDATNDTLPYRNLLKKPYTRIKLPVFKEKRGGSPLSKSEAKKQSDMLYEKVIKKYSRMLAGQQDIYRTYHINLVSSLKVLEFKV